MPRNQVTANITVNGMTHRLEAVRKGNSFHLSVDGREVETCHGGASGYWVGVYQDFPVEVDGVTCYLAVRRTDMRFAADGRYLDNGLEHTPPAPMPRWIFLFALLDVLLVFVAVRYHAAMVQAGGSYLVNGAMGGAMAALLAACGFIFCVYFARGGAINKKTVTSIPLQILICFLVTVLVWGAWYLLAAFTS